MRVEIWSDVVCPWCFIGKRRFEAALAAFPHSDDVDVVWRSYLLDPSAPDEPVETVAEALGRKYGGGPDAGRQMIDRVTKVAADEGMHWRHDESLRVGTVDAHRLLHLAFSEGGASLQAALEEALFSAYFEQARNVADHATLTEIATGVGLDTARVREVLDSKEFQLDVEADFDEAASLGAGGVPFFVFDRKYAVSGAQPVETFTQILERVWDESRPTLQMVGNADACGPDGCAV